MTRQRDAACAVVRAGQDDIEMLSQLIAGALRDDPVSRWLVPAAAPDIRRRILAGFFALLAGRALTGGLLYTTAGRDGAALWLPAGGPPATPPGGYAQRLAEITGPWAGQFRIFDTILDQHHPAGPAHHHLAILAVRPGMQGRGTGTALLAAHHAWLDQHALPAYLEASTTRSRDLYLRHGYQPRPDGPIRLPGGPCMWPMWREPRSPSAAGQTAEQLRGRRAELRAGASLYPAGTATRQDIQRRTAAIDAELEQREQDGENT